MPTATQTAPVLAICQNCGAEVPADSAHCPACGRLTSGRSTKITVAVTLLLIVAGIVLTQYFVNLHRVTEMDLARRWFNRGEEAMRANLPKFAAEAYRTALNYDRENDRYRLRLAQALMADNRLAEARAHLLSLWEEEPANGEVNLTLAQLEARRGNYREAVRYYNNAINGVWRDDPRKHRTEARFELARYLMQNGKLPQAQADLMELLADAPSDPADQLLLGHLLLQLNDPGHALQAYNALLAKNGGDAQAWMGAGQAYLAMGNYAEAEHASAKAVESDPNLEGARQQLELTRELWRIDPSERGLPLAERANRVAKAFDAASVRLNQCALAQKTNLAPSGVVSPSGGSNATTAGTPASTAPNALQLLYTSGLQKQAAATPKALRKDPDALEPTMQYVFEVERTLAPICPNMSLTDRALLTLAQHESETSK